MLVLETAIDDVVKDDTSNGAVTHRSAKDGN